MSKVWCVKADGHVIIERPSFVEMYREYCLYVETIMLMTDRYSFVLSDIGSKTE